MKIIPVIKWSKGEPAEVMADSLVRQVRDTLKDSKNLFINNDLPDESFMPFR